MVQLTFASGVDARIKCFTQLVPEAIDSLDPLVAGIGHGGRRLGRRVRPADAAHDPAVPDDCPWLPEAAVRCVAGGIVGRLGRGAILAGLGDRRVEDRDGLGNG